MNKFRINLLKDELVAVQTWLTLTNVVRIWVAFLSLLIIFYAVLSYQNSILDDNYNELRKKKVQLSNQLEQYAEVIETRVENPRKVNQLAKMKFVFQNKQILHRQLTDRTQVRVSGFADVMTELATYHNSEISLSQVIISDDKVSMYGAARNADSVPNWLTGFEKSNFMAGKSFSHFALSVNDNGDTEFVVRSELEKGENE